LPHYDVFIARKDVIPHLTRSSLHRCLHHLQQFGLRVVALARSRRSQASLGLNTDTASTATTFRLPRGAVPGKRQTRFPW
jgi:hypothetical protein